MLVNLHTSPPLFKIAPALTNKLHHPCCGAGLEYRSVHVSLQSTCAQVINKVYMGKWREKSWRGIGGNDERDKRRREGLTDKMGEGDKERLNNRERERGRGEEGGRKGRGERDDSKGGTME